MNIALLIILILFLGIISFLLSACETSIISLNKIRIRSLINQGSQKARIIYRLITQLDRLIATILVGNNFVNIAISALGAAIFIQLFGQRWGILISTAVITFFVLVFCEITPKILAVKYPEAISLSLSRVIDAMIKLMHPLTRFFTTISNGIIGIFRIKPTKRTALVTEEEIRLMIEIGKEEGILPEEERKLLHRIFEFGDTLVKDVMIAREKIVCVDLNASHDQLLNQLVEEGHARLPVYHDSIDNITGIIYAKDLPFIWKEKDLIHIADLIYQPFFVLPNKKVSELLRDFQKNKIQIAIVRDEAGKTLGLVTLEDIIEEIVGEIEEEPR